MDSQALVDAAATRSSPTAAARRLERAELLAIGSELTTGDTRDSNAADLARSLSEHGVRVTRLVKLPDDREAVAAAFVEALARADLVVATGGLGPTPDDLTREAIADAVGETPLVDPALERWVRGLWTRRRMPFPESNLKQAWLVPSATALPNDHGTAPGWWVDRPDGRIVVALPGPPREMHSMWDELVLPRLVERGLGRQSVVRTLRLAGIGESQAADRIGRELLDAPNPDVATFAKADGIDVRVIAFEERGRAAAEVADDAVARVLAAVGDRVWAEGRQTWAGAIDAALAARGLRLATREAGTDGALIALLGRAERLVDAQFVRSSAAGTHSASPAEADATADVVVLDLAVRSSGGGDLDAEIAVDGPGIHISEHATAFLRDDQGRARAAVLAAWALLRALRGGGTTT